MASFRYLALFFITSHMVLCGVAAGKATAVPVEYTRGQDAAATYFPYDVYGLEALSPNARLTGNSNLRLVYISTKDKKPGQPLKSVTITVEGRKPLRVNYFDTDEKSLVKEFKNQCKDAVAEEVEKFREYITKK